MHWLEKTSRSPRYVAFVLVYTLVYGNRPGNVYFSNSASINKSFDWCILVIHLARGVANWNTFHSAIRGIANKTRHGVCLCAREIVNQPIEAEWHIEAITGSDNGLSPIRQQAIILTNAGLLLIKNQGTYFMGIYLKFFHFIISGFEDVLCKMMVILFQTQSVKARARA